MADILLVGGGLAGMATATLLAMDGHEVTVLERDPAPLPEDAAAAWDSWHRRGVGQFRQAYGLQPLLSKILQRELPAVMTALERFGATRKSFLEQLEAGLPERETWMGLPEYEMLTARRPTVELAFATVAEAQPGVTVRRGVGVREYFTGPSAMDGVVHVAGVVTEQGESLRADLVIDASGRNSRIGERLVEVGAPAPSVKQVDNSTIYYTRYYRAPDGIMPEHRGGGYFTPGQGCGLFMIPADNGTWCLSVWGLAEDNALRPLRNVELFNQVVRRFPDRDHWMQGEPISDIMPCISAGDLTRRFVIDGKPIVTGLFAVGDTHGFTEPRLGRGTLSAVKQAVALRDTLRAHLEDGPAALAVAWDDIFQRELGPLLRATNSAGRTFAKEVRAFISGVGPTFDPTDRGMVLNRAFLNAARVDAQVGRWLLDVGGSEILPAELFAQPGVLDRILELGDHDGMQHQAGPTRAELLNILS